MTQESQWLTDKYWVSPFNFAAEVREQFTLPERVYIHDVTLREAHQSPRVCLRPEEKIRIAKALDKLGVDSIENGAYMSETEKEVTKELVKMHREGELKAKVTPLVHSTEQDIDIALETGADRVLISQDGNPWTAKVLHGIDENGLVERLTKAVFYAKRNGLFVTAQIYDTYRTPLELLERLHKSVVYEGGADRLAISDTFGCALPWTVTYMVRKVKSWIPGIPIEHHGHNDYGLATPLMVAAVVGGAEVIHTSVTGVGERVGNATTEEVAMALELLLGVKTGIDLSQIYSTCELVAELTKNPIPRNKPITGENEFLTGSGMVAWRYFKVAKTDRPNARVPFAPEIVGKKGYEVILGVGCGRAIVADRLEKMGISATREQMAEIAQKVKDEANIRKWSVPDVQFEEIVKSVLEK
ncbi:2-phosphonomethylmalate synthase [subsurface metagenome]